MTRKWKIVKWLAMEGGRESLEGYLVGKRGAGQMEVPEAHYS